MGQINAKIIWIKFGSLIFYSYISFMIKHTILTHLSEIERDLKAKCEHSTNDMDGDKWSKHHDNIQSLIKDLLNG